MSVTKYPVLDPDFLLKMLGSCADEWERGLVIVLHYSGCHVSSISKGAKPVIIKEGVKTYFQWVRPKTRKTLRVLIPSQHLKPVQFFLSSNQKTPRWLNMVVKRIGERAGYEGISSMTFRHNRCIRAIEEGYNPFEIPQVMGCTPEVVFRNYSKLREDQLHNVAEGEQE